MHSDYRLHFPFFFIVQIPYLHICSLRFDSSKLFVCPCAFMISVLLRNFPYESSALRAEILYKAEVFFLAYMHN